jgi:hypothetical protein
MRSRTCWTFCWMLYIPLDNMDLVPLDILVVAITTLYVKTGHEKVYDEVGEKCRNRIMEGAKPYQIVRK